MCFRPASAASSIKCPKCGFDNPSVTDTCLECDADLTEVKKAFGDAAASAGDVAPSAPGASPTPPVPGAPKPPAPPVA